MVDEAIIDALYRASQAGVKVDVDGPRHLLPAPWRPGTQRKHQGPFRPGPLPGTLTRLRFCQRRRPVVYIGSADMMHRNLDRRVEALVQLASKEDTATVMDMLRRYVDDGTASWHLDNHGHWTRHHLARTARLAQDMQSWLLASRSRQRPA